MAKLTNKYDVVQMGDTPDFMSGVYDVLEKYLDPEYQMRRRAEKEEQERYDTRQQQLIAQQNYTADINSYNQAQKDLELMLSSAKNPTQRNYILDNYGDKDKIFTIRYPDGSAENKTLNIDTLKEINDDSKTKEDAYKRKRKEFLTTTDNARKMKLYPELESMSLDLGIALPKSITDNYTSSKKYADNERVLNFMTTPEFLKGTGLSVENANTMKEFLIKGDLTDSSLEAFTSYLDGKTKSRQATIKFYEKLYETTLDNYGKLEEDPDPTTLKALSEALNLAKKGLGMSDEESTGGTGGTGGIGFQIPENMSREEIAAKMIELAGGQENFDDLSDEEAKQMATLAIETLTKEKSSKGENPKNQTSVVQDFKEEYIEGKNPYSTIADIGTDILGTVLTGGYGSRISELYNKKNPKAGRSEEAKKSRANLEEKIRAIDPLQQKLKYGNMINIGPLNKSEKNVNRKILIDPISNKLVSRKELLNKIKNNRLKYGRLGIIYDPNAKIDYINKDGVKESYLVGYRKTTPKEALSTLP